MTLFDIKPYKPKKKIKGKNKAKSLFQPIKVKPFSPISFNNKKPKTNKVGGLFQPIPPSKKTKGLFQPAKMTPIKITPITALTPLSFIFIIYQLKIKKEKGRVSLILLSHRLFRLL